MKRVLLLNNVPTPYFDPLFEALGRDGGWALTVCYAAAWNRAVGWEGDRSGQSAAHRTIVLDQRLPRVRARLGSWVAAAAALLSLLQRERPDYLLCYGYTLLPQTTALLWALLTRTPYALIGDANYYNDAAGGLKRWAKRLWLRGLVRRAAAVIAVGTASRLFWQAYGARDAQLFHAGFAVDNDVFERDSEGRRRAAVALRERWGLGDRIVFLSVGRLIRRKNVDLLLRALRELNDDRLALVIAGAGEERASLEALADGFPNVRFAGAVAPDDLPALYTMADALALVAEQEPWGLVVNEAMAAGLAVLAHRRCGAALDLVDDDNGALVDRFDVDEIKSAMRALAADPARLAARKRCSREKIKNWTIDRAACGIIRAVEESAAQGPRPWKSSST